MYYNSNFCTKPWVGLDHGVNFGGGSLNLDYFTTPLKLPAVRVFKCMVQRMVYVISGHGCNANRYRRVPAGFKLEFVAMPSCSLPSEMAEIVYDREAYLKLLKKHYKVQTCQEGDVYPDLNIKFTHKIGATPHGVFSESVFGQTAELFKMRGLPPRARNQDLKAFESKHDQRHANLRAPDIYPLSKIIASMGPEHYLVAVCRKVCDGISDTNKILMQSVNASYPAWPAQGLQEPVNAALLKSHNVGRRIRGGESIIDPESMHPWTKSLISGLLTDEKVDTRTRGQKRLRNTGHYILESKYR